MRARGGHTRSPTFTDRGFDVVSPPGPQLGWSLLRSGNVSFEGLCDAGETVADLYIDSQALTDFAGQLRGLLADFSTPMLPPGGVCDYSVLDEMSSLSSTDTACGYSLDNYMRALAGLAEQAAQAAESVDSALAKDVPSRIQGHRIQEAF